MKSTIQLGSAVLLLSLLSAFLTLMPADVAGQDLDRKLAEAAKKGRVDDMRLLLEQGVNVDGADKNGRTAAMAAAEGGHVEALRALVDGGANVAMQDKDGRTTLSLAAKKGHSDAVALLTDALESLVAARYRSGDASHDQVLRDFPRTEYASYQLALLYSGKHTADTSSSLVAARAKTAPDVGLVRIGYYKGREPATYSTRSDDFVVLAELHFRAGALVEAKTQALGALPSVFATTISSGRMVRVGRRLFSLGGTASRASRPMTAAGEVDRTRPANHEELEIVTPLFMGS